MDAGASGASNAIDGTADGRPGIDVMVLASSSSCSSSTSIARRLVTSSGTAWRSSASIEYSATSVPTKAVCEISGICTWNTAVPSTSMNGLENCGTCVLRAAVNAASDAVAAPWCGSDGSSALLRRLAAPRKIEPRKVARGVRSALSQITCVSSGRAGAKLAVWVKKLSVSTSWVTMSRVSRTISSWSSLRRDADLLLGDLGVAPHGVGGALDLLVAQRPERGHDGRQEQQHGDQRPQRGEAILARRRLAAPPAAEHALRP